MWMVRLARVLWIAWAIVVWNVVFDHVIVVAGRNVIVAAGEASRATPPAAPVNMDNWMRPAVTHGVWMATAAAGAILLAGLLSVNHAARRLERSTGPSDR